MATHAWPALNMAAAWILGATSFGSTSSSTTAASLPPGSSVRRFKVPPALAITFLPVGVEPVNTTLATSGWLVRAVPRSVLIDDDVDDACRQDAGTEFAELERRQRCGRGRLGHDPLIEAHA